MSLTTTHPCKYPGCACTAGTFPLAGIDPVTAGPLFANCDCGHVFSQHASVIGAIDLDTNTNPAVISRRSRAPFRTPSPPSTAAATINQGQALPTPPAGSPGRASSHLCPRTTTVQNLLKRVLAQRVVLVRGTPAIGKSTLLQLLFHYVRDHPQRQPPICPFRISTWDKDRVMYSGNWRKYILHQTDGKLNLLADDQLPGQYLLMIDEAQSSYWDQQFWSDYVKQLAQGTWPTTAYLILFSSHGSHTELGAGIPAVTPPYLVPSQQVGLQKNAEDNPVGLLLTHEEFQDALQRKLATKTHPLRDTNSPEIEDYLFGITQGHAGALDGIIEALYAHQVISRQISKSGGITDCSFIHDNFFADKAAAIQALQKASFCRGLPTRRDMQNPDIANVFSLVLRHKSMPQVDIAEPLLIHFSICHRKGWIHVHTPPSSSDASLSSSLDTNTFVMASPLHEWFVAVLLTEVNPYSAETLEALFPTPIDLAIASIKLFRPSHLRRGQIDPSSVREQQQRTLAASVTSPSQLLNLGPAAVPRPKEAIYQDEFHRSFGTKYLPNPASIISEFGDGRGRIDFFIPQVQWGIEFLRDFSDVDGHLRRFALGGGYNSWKVLRNWVVLNCTTEEQWAEKCGKIEDGDAAAGMAPIVNTSNAKNLYHILFTEDFSHVHVRDDAGRVLLPLTKLLEENTHGN